VSLAGRYLVYVPERRRPDSRKLPTPKATLKEIPARRGALADAGVIIRRVEGHDDRDEIG